MNKKRNIAILIFDDAEVLDFAGPFEVFSVTSELNNQELLNVFTIAKEKVPIKAVNGLSVNPKYSFDDHPPINLLIIAGGAGTRQQMEDEDTLKWITQTKDQLEYLVSICSGARLLGVLGLLDNSAYCTHHEVYEHMKQIVPSGIPQANARFVRSGNIFTSGGISAGIDLSFHIVALLHGENIALKTATYMEYDWQNLKS